MKKFLAIAISLLLVSSAAANNPYFGAGGGAAGNLTNGTVATQGLNTIQRTLAAHFSDVKNAADFGVVCDGTSIADINITNGAATLSSVGYVFTAANVGQTVVVSNVGETQGQQFTISSISGNNAVLSGNWTGTTISTNNGRATFYTTDNTTALALAISSFGQPNAAGYNQLGFRLNLPNGVCVTGPQVLPRLSILQCADSWNGCTLFLKSNSNATLITSEGFSANTGTGNNYGTTASVPSWFGLADIHLDGNKVMQTSGNCYSGYGNMQMMLGSVLIENCHDNGMYTEASAASAYNGTDWKSQEEGVFQNVKTRNNGVAGQVCGTTHKGCGWLDRGPHDKYIANFIDAESQSTGYRNETTANYAGTAHADKMHAYAESDGTAFYLGAGGTFDEIYADFGNLEVAAAFTRIGAIYTTSVGYLGLDGIIIDPAATNSNIGQINLEFYASAGGAAATVTMTIASPCVLTWNSNGLVVGQSVTLATSGALPTGLSPNVTYYVTAPTTNTFELSTTRANALAGTAINTTGTQSGTQTAISTINGVNILSGASGSFGPIVGSSNTPSGTITLVNDNGNFTELLGLQLSGASTTNSDCLRLAAGYVTVNGSAFNCYNFIDFAADGPNNNINFAEYLGSGTNYKRGTAAATDWVNTPNDAGTGGVTYGNPATFTNALTDNYPSSGSIILFGGPGLGTIDNLIIGSFSPLAGTFTTLVANTLTNTPVLQLNSNETPATPGGRLSLSSTLPVPTSDITAATTIYYLTYNNNLIPIYNGTHWQEFAIGASGFSQGIAVTNQPTTQVYDLYAVNVSGTVTMCSMYWGGNTSRSTTAGGKTGTANASITQLNGIWVNNAAIATANCYGGAAGVTSVTIAQNQGTLLGSYYTSANGQTQVVCNPAAASGGAAIGVYLSNAYNRIPISCSDSDTATAQTSVSASWAVLGAGDNAQFVDSLQQVPYSYEAFVVAGGSTTGVAAAFGVACAGTGTTAPTVFGVNDGPTATLADNYSTISVKQGFYPILGLSNKCFAEKQSPSTTSVTYMPTTTEEGLTINLAY